MAILNRFYCTGNARTLVNGEFPDEMPQKVAFIRVNTVCQNKEQVTEDFFFIWNLPLNMEFENF